MRLLTLLFPWFFIKRLETELETERMRLAGCGVAALMNTRKAAKDRITPDNPYWSASYGDVCATVDREMNYREMLEREVDDIDNIIKHLGWKPEDFRTETGFLMVGKLKSALSDIVRPGSGG